MLWVDRRRMPELELEPGCYLKFCHPAAGCVLGARETAVNERRSPYAGQGVGIYVNMVTAESGGYDEEIKREFRNN